MILLSSRSTSQTDPQGKVTPSNLEVSGHQWTIGGNRIKNYTQSLNEGSKIALEVSDLTDDTVTFYWIDGGENIGVAYEASIHGLPFAAAVNCDVERPDAALTSVTTPLNPPISVRFGYMRYGSSAPNEQGIRVFYGATRGIPILGVLL